MPDPVTPPPASPARPTCASCRWWGEILDGCAPPSGACKRRAPVALGDGDWDAMWPLTNHDDWCGEHAPIEAPRG